jgi:DNA-binding XRE family transcriptional regulator
MKYKLKEVRKRKGLTQKQLSEVSHVSKTTIINIETGVRHQPSIDTLNKLAGALGCQTKDIFA